MTRGADWQVQSLPQVRKLMYDPPTMWYPGFYKPLNPKTWVEPIKLVTEAAGDPDPPYIPGTRPLLPPQCAVSIVTWMHITAQQTSVLLRAGAVFQTYWWSYHLCGLRACCYYHSFLYLEWFFACPLVSLQATWECCNHQPNPRSPLCTLWSWRPLGRRKRAWETLQQGRRYAYLVLV